MDKGPTSTQERILRVAARGERISSRIDFLHSALCQIGLPRSKVMARTFERQEGSLHLRIEAGVLLDGKRWVEQPLPYGARPRLILVHLCGEALRLKTRDINVGKSLHAFMKGLNLKTNGDGYERMRAQINALAACEMRIGFSKGFGDKYEVTMHKITPIEDFTGNVFRESKNIIWPKIITISERFYESLKEHAVPLANEALAALKHSSLALDLYSWFAHRLCRIRIRQDLFLDWAALHQQFGPEYTEVRSFRPELLTALRQVLAVYPDAKVEIEQLGLKLNRSNPPIVKGKSVKLITKILSLDNE